MPKCALAVSVKSGKKKEIYSKEDKKIYVLSPSFMSLSNHSAIMSTFQNTIYNASSIKADISVLLFYTKQFLGYVAHNGRPPRFGSIRNVVDGFYCTYFKKSGSQASAYSLTALSYIQLPEWVSLSPLPSLTEIQAWLTLIEEQEKVIFFRYPINNGFDDFLDENMGEGLRLLRLYREWLSGGSLEFLLEFQAGFAPLIMSQAAQKKHYRQFSISGLTRLLSLMNTSTTPTLQEIISDKGFLEIARAIRLSTVTAQRLKSKGIKPGHEIRYGLAQELKRKAPFKDEFVAALMGFIQTYQAENARQRERGKTNLHEVTKSQLASICVLIDRCPIDAEPIASLLIAFGYAFDDTRNDDKDGAEDFEKENNDSQSNEIVTVTP